MPVENQPEDDPQAEETALPGNDAPPNDSAVVADEAVTSPESDSTEGGSGTDVADASVVDSTAPDQPQYQDWQQPLIEAGLAGDDLTDPAQWSQRSVQALQERDRRIQELADRVRFYETQQRYAAPPAETAPPAPEPEQDPIEQLAGNWEDRRWAEQFVEVDEDTGARRLRADINDADRERVMQIDRNVRQWEEMLSDPRQLMSAIDGRIQSIVARQFDSGWQERTAQQQDEQIRDLFVNENASWLYAHDPATNQVLRDPVSGTPAYSQEGQEFLQYMEHVAGMGVDSLAGQIQLASDMRLARVNQQAAAPGERRQQVASVVQQKRREKLGTSNLEPNTATAVNGVSNEDLPDSMSYGQKVLQALKQGQQ
jgi:hypothetical protein